MTEKKPEQIALTPQQRSRLAKRKIEDFIFEVEQELGVKYIVFPTQETIVSREGFIKKHVNGADWDTPALNLPPEG